MRKIIFSSQWGPHSLVVYKYTLVIHPLHSVFFPLLQMKQMHMKADYLLLPRKAEFVFCLGKQEIVATLPEP